jgi:hypothetical protein
MEDTGQVYYYNEYAGIYVRTGESLIKEQLEILRPNISNKLVNEVLQKVKRRTPISQLVRSPLFLNFNNIEKNHCCVSVVVVTNCGCIFFLV